MMIYPCHPPRQLCRPYDGRKVSQIDPTSPTSTNIADSKEHKVFFRIESVSRILPLEKFTETCQKVYFAVDPYSELDYILANAYLSYVFYEYIVATGKAEYQNHWRQYRRNAQVALSRLPLLLPASLEAVAALTFGASSLSSFIAKRFLSPHSDEIKT